MKLGTQSTTALQSTTRVSSAQFPLKHNSAAMNSNWEEYQEYSRRRAEAGQAEASYRNWARQWIRRRTERPNEPDGPPRRLQFHQYQLIRPQTLKLEMLPSSRSGIKTLGELLPRQRPQMGENIQRLVTLTEADLSPFPAASYRRAGTWRTSTRIVSPRL